MNEVRGPGAAAGRARRGLASPTAEISVVIFCVIVAE